MENANQVLRKFFENKIRAMVKTTIHDHPQFNHPLVHAFVVSLKKRLTGQLAATDVLERIVELYQREKDDVHDINENS